ncbi:MAG: hypothetical protein DCF12_15105 [Snowella sp.]|jgi:hypothetical protein|nr:MAG: hypothetical protein DCF12_15105 [Snowella sp.]
MAETDITNLIREQLPQLIAQEPSVRDFVLRTVSNYYAGKQETESKFDRILAELQRDREEQARKWDENNRKWDENNKRLDKMQEQTDQTLAEIKKANRKYDSTIGALGSRWGLYSEASFRNGLKGILETSFGVEVLNLNDFDHDGEVFGRPDQVEIDVIIKNGSVILCEIKSSMSKADMYIFDRKVAYYEKHHQRTVDRKLVMSPMVDQRAISVAENLGIEIFSYADSMESL